MAGSGYATYTLQSNTQGMPALNHLKQQLQFYAIKIHDLETALASKNTESQKLVTENQKLATENQRLTTETKQLTTNLSFFKDTCTGVIKQNTTLNQTIEQLKASAAHVANLEEINQKMMKLRQDNESLKILLTSALKKSSLLEAELFKLREQLQKLLQDKTNDVLFFNILFKQCKEENAAYRRKYGLPSEPTSFPLNMYVDHTAAAKHTQQEITNIASTTPQQKQTAPFTAVNLFPPLRQLSHDETNTPSSPSPMLPLSPLLSSP